MLLTNEDIFADEFEFKTQEARKSEPYRPKRANTMKHGQQNDQIENLLQMSKHFMLNNLTFSYSEQDPIFYITEAKT